MPYRMIQVGLGDFGRRWLSIVNRHPDWEYAAIATRNEQVRAECGVECGLPAEKQFASLADALDAGVTADALLVTTPYFRHREEVLLGLAAGLHVLVEKPLAGTWSECREICEKAETGGRIVMVGENYRFGDGAVAVRDIVAAGEIGTPEFLRLGYFVGHAFPEHDWRNEYAYPLLIENATHQFDLVRFVTGCDAEEVHCTAFGSERTPNWKYPSVSAVFRMKGSLVFEFSASWAYREFATPWEGEWVLYGTHGALRWSRDRIEVESASGRREVKAVSRDSDYTLTATFEEFTDALVSGRNPSTGIGDNINTVAMVYAAIESAETRVPVDINALLKDARFSVVT